MAVVDRVTDLVLPLIESAGLKLYDVEVNGPILRVTVDGPNGVLLDDLAELTKTFSRALDEADPLPSSYTLEVSSPGLERRLRTAAHFEGAVGEEVSIKLGPHVDGPRRVRGTIQSADQTQVSVAADPAESGEDAELVVIAFDDITKAVTVFDWSPAPKPGQGSGKQRSDKGSDTSKESGPSPTDDFEKRAGVS
ncbi:MAG: ribosome maturation factor RimP [Acidimicrobiales bacterium]